MKKILAYLSVFGTFAWASQAGAVIGCAGPVTGIELRSDGLVIGDWGFGPVEICYLSADTAMPTTIVKKEACGAIYAQFLSAMNAHQTITSYHMNSTTCAQALPNNPNASHYPTEQPYGFHINN